MDKVTHFEIPADNVDRAKDFYKNVFDWEIVPMPEMNYTIVRTVEVDDKQMPKEVAAINGGIAKRNENFKSPVIVMNVVDIDKSVEKIKKAGGQVLGEKMQVGDMGLYIYAKDPEGNVIGVWQNLK